MTTHDEVATSSVVRGAIAGLCEVAGAIGDPHVRNRGTIGGSVANNDPAADYPGRAAGARCHASAPTSARSRPTISSRACSPPRSATARSSRASPSPSRPSSPTSSSPTRPRATRWSASRWPRPARRSRVAVTGAGSSGVFRHKAMEAALAKDWSAQSLAGVATNAVRHDERHPRRCRLSRPPRRRAGPSRSGQGRLTCRLGQA